MPHLSCFHVNRPSTGSSPAEGNCSGVDFLAAIRSSTGTGPVESQCSPLSDAARYLDETLPPRSLSPWGCDCQPAPCPASSRLHGACLRGATKASSPQLNSIHAFSAGFTPTGACRLLRYVFLIIKMRI